MKICVLGCGRWGSFIGWYLNHIGHEVTLYGREGSVHLQQFIQTRTNGLVELPKAVALTNDLSVCGRADVLVISVAAQGLRQLMGQLQQQNLQNQPVVLCMKGIEMGSCKRLSEVAEEYLPASCPVAVWLGPGHVQEFYRGVPNCMAIDSRDEGLKEQLITAFSGDLIRFYYGQDLIGNEIGAASKNVIGIAAGMLDGCGLASLKGALMSRGTREIARLIAALGGNELSAYGLCHLGDYEATVFSPYSHNRRFGEAFIRKEPYDKLAEGYYTVVPLLELADKHGVELPICQAVYALLYEGADTAETINGLFTRSLKKEF